MAEEVPRSNRNPKIMNHALLPVSGSSPLFNAANVEREEAAFLPGSYVVS
jgi:hypothetical protein